VLNKKLDNVLHKPDKLSKSSALFWIAVFF